jgi:hypothetical protein
MLHVIEIISLTRTSYPQNLDVNLAVNNLLSRDEEDGDEQEEGESYIPGGKLSLSNFSVKVKVLIGQCHL